ncbi:MAG: aldose 1-epimerase family protein [Planctomycetaceae bacterium]|jgi:hypothetical protein|nr:aldose 1-epimerase family protein [Planctomycetaceae bacterium]
MKPCILTDTVNGIYTESFDKTAQLANHQLKKTFPIRITKRTLHGGTSEGVDEITIDNGTLSLSVLPTRGMGIRRVTCGDVELKWNSPIFGPVHPSFVPLSDAGGLGWLEGFDEWLVRCGLENNGSPEWDKNGKLVYGLHGRLANLPARYVSLSIDEATGRITLTGKVVESKLFFKKLELTSELITFAGSPDFIVRDTITNLSAEQGEYQFLYHINTGQPFAAPGGRVVVPFKRMAPRTSSAVENLPQWDTLCPETPGSTEVVFFFEPAYNRYGRCPVMLVNRKGDRALTLSFGKEFPYFSFWKSRLADADGYVCGLEPSINLPNNKSFEKKHGRVGSLVPGESRIYELYFGILQDKGSIQKNELDIRSISPGGKIEPKPVKDWTP